MIMNDPDDWLLTTDDAGHEPDTEPIDVLDDDG
jgi:hypothetical protein